MYYIKEYDIIRWCKRNNLDFIKCACKVTENYKPEDNDVFGSKREEIKNLINDLRKVYKNIDMNIFRSVQNVNLDTLISYRKKDEIHHFMDEY